MKEQDWLFEDSPEDFQLVGEVIKEKTWEEKQAERMRKIEENAHKQSPDLFQEKENQNE